MALALVKLLENDFEPWIRSRGDLYFRQGRVIITQGSPTGVHAKVRGSRNYNTRVLYEEGDVVMNCTCPYAYDGGPCKHIWATLRAAEHEGWLRGIPADALESLEADFEDGLDHEDSSDFMESYEDEFGGPLLFDVSPRRGAPLAFRPPPPSWRSELDRLDTMARYAALEPWPRSRQVLYAIEKPDGRTATLTLQLLWRDPKAKGVGWNKPKQLRLTSDRVAGLPDPEDRDLLSLLAGPKDAQSYYLGGTAPQRLGLHAQLAHQLLPLMCRTGRCVLLDSVDAPLGWDDGPPWEVVAELSHAGKQVRLRGALIRGDERLELPQDGVLVASGVLLRNGVLARVTGADRPAWLQRLTEAKALEAPASQRDQMVSALLELPTAPRLVLPENMRIEQISVAPVRHLVISAAGGYAGERNLAGELCFEYGDVRVSSQQQTRAVFDAGKSRLVHRNAELEAEARERLRQLGGKEDRHGTYHGCCIPADKLPSMVRTLIQEGWKVETQGRLMRQPASSGLELRSGIDWFELHGQVDFGEGATASLPALLAAVRKKEEFVRLDDGTLGMLPEEFLARIAPLASLGTAAGDHLRFRRTQVGLLDALLAAQPEARFDETFARARQRLREFESIAPLEQPSGFEGQLRGYQKDGLGWMRFLRGFGFGGCLADDMGVGKTAQVLAMLEHRRAVRAGETPPDGEGAPTGPSLAVVPKSLVFNWKQEAARFTPRLKILDYTGGARSIDDLSGADLVITTYGTLRRDVPRLQEFEFDYLVLDEAQAVKNAATASAKAVRLLKGRHRLALSGTPVENHLGELWSLFEFLNPGMLGVSSKFTQAGGSMRKPDEATRQMLAQALRPFILRRTKQQVASELPPKTEQTIYCEMEDAQQRLYNDLRDHYRGTLLGRIERSGMAKSKMHVLEALLRLRQAACHPALLDPKRKDEPSAKLDFLMEQLEEVLDEQHKVLVFSQFTSLLALVRERLHEQGIEYEYLDGQTSNREQVVKRFQTSRTCRLFLISLKAGGLGLNLTAAEYVYLLDPWWNPAVEAQAIDRTHRIGQSKPVFAYRLITRGTVEEKVLELQQTKRNLADAIISEDNSLIRDLRREDLELLLS